MGSFLDMLARRRARRSLREALAESAFLFRVEGAGPSSDGGRDVRRVWFVAVPYGPEAEMMREVAKAVAALDPDGRYGQPTPLANPHLANEATNP